MKKLIDFTDRHIEMVELLQKEQGFKSFTGSLFNCITVAFEKKFPAYRSGLALKSGFSDEETINRKAKMKVDLKKAEQEQKDKEKYTRKASICTNILFGTVDDGEYGKVCRFNTYYANGEISEQIIPLTQCDPVLADNNLFIPNKESVLAKFPQLANKLKVKK